MKYLIFLVSLALAECYNGQFGVRINRVDWTQYVTNIKDQGHTPLCWAYSATSYIEIMYNFMTGLKHTFSAMQVGENSQQQVLTRYNETCYNPSKILTSGHARCAIKYIDARGLMLEKDYKLYGYDVGRIFPLIVKSFISMYRINNISQILDKLEKTPLLVYYDSSNYKNPDEIIVTNTTTHTAVLTNICQRNHTIYLELLDSYFGSRYNGYAYVRITNETKHVINNRNILSYFHAIDISIPIQILPRAHNYIPVVLASVSNWLTWICIALLIMIVYKKLKTSCFITVSFL